MKINSLTVKNFRSIDKLEIGTETPLPDTIFLVCLNGSGKSSRRELIAESIGRMMCKMSSLSVKRSYYH